MSPIQRYYQSVTGGLVPHDDGPYVLHSGHLAALRDAKQYGVYKDETATVFMNQVKRLQAELAALSGKDGWRSMDTATRTLGAEPILIAFKSGGRIVCQWAGHSFVSRPGAYEYQESNMHGWRPLPPGPVGEGEG